NKRKIWLGGDGRLYLALGVVSSSAWRFAYFPQVSTEPGPLLNGVLWMGDASRVFAMSGGGLTLYHRVSQSGILAGRDTDKRIHGRLSLPRCAQLNTINVLISGDSLGTTSPQSQASIFTHTMRFMEEFRRQNPGKTINIYNIAVGGQTWASLWHPNRKYNDTSLGNGWVVPRPVVGTVTYTDFLTNINRTATSSTNPIVPDLVVFLECAGNDAWGFDGGAMHAMINIVRSATHADGFGPTDVILQTDLHAAVNNTMSSGIAGGVSIPDVFTR